MVRQCYAVMRYADRIKLYSELCSEDICHIHSHFNFEGFK